MRRYAGNQWNKSLIFGLCLGLALLPACATSKRGKTQQAGKVLISLNRVMLDECTASKANGWEPLSKDVCRLAGAAYGEAFDAWETTLDLLDTDPKANTGKFLTVILRYVLITTDILVTAGIEIPENVSKYVGMVKEGMFK